MSTSTPTRGRAAALPPEERRSTIVDATIPLLLEHGGAVTTRQIAEATGIAEGTIFRVFADKDAVISAAVESVLEPGPLDAELARIDRSLPIHDRLVAATAMVQERVVTVWRLLSAIGPRPQDPPRSMSESPALADLLADDASTLRVPPAVAARRLRALTLALTHPTLAPEPVPPAEIVDMFLHGLATGEPPCC